ncbi:MAG: hypothetical protein V7K64_24860 [Nostoc sp.]|uniref:hypothetical protein n=1 Tax=unclassified Nostoc TaxID=2593658 RepID=UPI001D8C1360|nr:hypothetical protein [Nostoc sp. JL34]MBN3883765.1 hypothetical protein [Nostoc sp. JL34]
MTNCIYFAIIWGISATQYHKGIGDWGLNSCQYPISNPARSTLTLSTSFYYGG